MKKPNLFIVGQPKSGTTALHDFLGKHPQIFMSGVKEPIFFAKDFHDESDRYHKSQLFYHFRTEETYLKLFSSVTSEKVIGESSTGYLYSKVSARKIYEFNPQAKIIIILREPVSFLYSLHSQFLNINAENEPDFVKALELETARKLGKKIPKTVQIPSALFYSERIKYCEQVKRYYDLFGKDRIKVIVFEDFQQNNQAIYQEIFEFLEINSDFVPENTRVNSRSQPRYKIVNNILYHPLARAIAYKCLPPEVNEFIKRNIVEKIFWKKSRGSKIAIDVKHQLMQIFSSEVQNISDFMQIDLINKWQYDRI